MADPSTAPTAPDAGSVDTTPFSQLERRNSLEKHLQTRPEEQDLKNRHILLDTTAAPALQAKQAGLERQRITVSSLQPADADVARKLTWLWEAG